MFCRLLVMVLSACVLSTTAYAFVIRSAPTEEPSKQSETKSATKYDEQDCKRRWEGAKAAKLISGVQLQPDLLTQSQDGFSPSMDSFSPSIIVDEQVWNKLPFKHKQSVVVLAGCAKALPGEEIPNPNGGTMNRLLIVNIRSNLTHNIIGFWRLGNLTLALE